MVSHKGRLYLVAGMGQTNDLASIEMFCPIKQQWTLLDTQMENVAGRNTTRL